MYFLVAGINSSGRSSIHSLDFARDELKDFPGIGNVVAIGTMPDVQKIATAAIPRNLKSQTNENILRLDGWCREIVSAEVKNDPVSVGFPAHLVVLKRFREPVVLEVTTTSAPHNDAEVVFP
jgi:hypothetical protein